MRAREILLWVVVLALLLLCLRCATVQADGILRGTAGNPVDDTWTLWHEFVPLMGIQEGR